MTARSLTAVVGRSRQWASSVSAPGGGDPAARIFVLPPPPPAANSSGAQPHRLRTRSRPMPDSAHHPPLPWYRRLAHLPAPLLLAVATVVCLAPFLHKAVHVDDYLFIRSAQHILRHPADPFGFMVNWYGFDAPCFLITQNPPVACYYLAAAGGLLGWGETGLHLAMLLPTIAAVLGIHAVARRLCPQPALAAVLALLTPVFWLSATTLMCDTLMLAFWIWALEHWLRGMETGRRRHFATAAGLLVLGVLTKYFALALVPLLLVYTLMRERRPSWKLLWLLAPAAALVAFDLATRRLYGVGLASGAVHYISNDHVAKNGWRHGLVLPAFTGGCLLPLLCFAPRLWSWKQLVGGLVFCGVVVVASPCIGTIGHFPLRAEGATNWLRVVQLAGLATVGLTVLVLVVLELRAEFSAETILLSLWVLGTLFFTSVVNWSINGRSLLPLAPAVAILMVRHLRRRSADPAPARWRTFWPLLPAALAGAIVVHADAQLADNYRTAARVLHEQLGGRPGQLWFQGHWGFQYYMEAAGAKALDQRHPKVRPGELVVTPDNNTNLMRLPPLVFAPAGDVEIELGPVITLRTDACAGFYSEEMGLLPFALAPGQSQRFTVERMRTRAWGP